MSDRWPKWMEQASKGDLIRFAIYQRTVNVKLGSVMLALINGDKATAQQDWMEYSKANDELGNIVDQIGGDH